LKQIDFIGLRFQLQLNKKELQVIFSKGQSVAIFLVFVIILNIF